MVYLQISTSSMNYSGISPSLPHSLPCCLRLPHSGSLDTPTTLLAPDAVAESLALTDPIGLVPSATLGVFAEFHVVWVVQQGS